MKRDRKNVGVEKSNKGVIVSGQATLHVGRGLVVGDDNYILDQSVRVQKEEDVLELIRKIEQQVSVLPKEMNETTLNIKAFASTLKSEAQKQSPNRSLWMVNGGGLVDAAKTVASIAPTLLETAKEVAAFFG